jgi:hypothetical protein
MRTLALLVAGISMNFAALRGAQVPLSSRWLSRQMRRMRGISNGASDSHPTNPGAGAAGALMLLMPRLLNDGVAAYLIITGAIGVLQ